jgi:hypothetical protein
MALQSSFLLAHGLARQPPATLDADRADALQRAYVAAWRQAFEPRLRLAAAFAHVAMHPFLAQPAATLLQRWPFLLTGAARFAGKARRAATQAQYTEESP